MEEYRPDLVIGTTPVVQKAKAAGTPALYFTNLISARPLFGPAGAGSLAEVINAAIGNRARMASMKSFFEGVGEGHAAGVWETTPEKRHDYKETYRKHLIKQNAAKKAEEMI